MTGKGRVASHGQFLFHCSYRGKATSKNLWLEHMYDNRVSTRTPQICAGLHGDRLSERSSKGDFGEPVGCYLQARNSLWRGLKSKSHFLLHVPSCQACLCTQAAWMPYQDGPLSIRGSSELTPMSEHKPVIISFHIVCWRLVPFVFGKPILCSTENLMRGNMVYPGSEAKLG